MSQGSNGYTNGYGSYASRSGNRYGDDTQDIGRERRLGGYGGFMNDSLSPPAEPPLQPPPRRRGYSSETNGTFALSRPDTNEGYNRGGERNGQDQKNARLYGTGPGGKQIEGVLEHIHDKWEILTQDDCVPVHVALQLMDHSSLGRGNDYHDFQKTSKQLQKALKAIVNEHHQGFNSSIGTFHKIQSSIHTSQDRVRTLRDSMIDSKSNLMVTKPELKGLGSSSQNYDEMLQVIGQIEKLQRVPEQLDARISEKHFLAAVDLLQDALRMIRKSEMEKIGALTDLRMYFTNQETSLTDILIEELHDHLYLKSPYCHDRWTPYTPDLANTSPSKTGAALLPSSWDKPLYRFLDGLDTSTPLGDDASENPEADSFHYIHMLIESLNKLGHLDIAVDRMEQRLPIELFAIVDRTNQEVNIRHPSHSRGLKNGEAKFSGFNLDGTSPRSGVMNDLLFTLYSKFEAIGEGHRAVHDVVAGIVKREGLRHSETLKGGFKELWKLYQSEMRSLLHDYLATDGSQAYRAGGQPTTATNIFQRHPRDKTRKVFKFSDIDKTSEHLVSEQEELDHILQASVPGLVSKSKRRSGVTNNKSAVVTDGPVTGHQLLIEPSVFNISLLLPPSLSFLQRLKDVVPPDSDIAISTLTSFLDDFLVNVFHPQLEETVTELCTRSFMEMDAFHQDPQWSQHSLKPIFKGTSAFFALIRAFCKLLDTIPQDQAFTQLVISQLVAYYNKCCEWYKTLVTKRLAEPQGTASLKAAAAMAESGDLRDIVSKLWLGEVSEEKDDLRHREIDLFIIQTNASPLEPFDIISDRRSVAALAMLYASIQYLSARLSQLRHISSSDPLKQPSRDSLKKSNPTRRWTLLATHQSIESNSVHLPLTPDTAPAFDSILASFRSLATTALLTLHLDIRCGVIHMLSRSLNEPYLLPQPMQEPDPSILALNADLLAFDDNLTTYLPAPEHAFITTGLALLCDTYLVRSAACLHAMNDNGCGRMQLNILVLQQNLKALEPDATLALAERFFAYFAEGADAIVARAKAAADEGEEGLGFRLEEMKVLVELCFSEGVRSEVREESVRAKRQEGEALLALSECMWDS